MKELKRHKPPWWRKLYTKINLRWYEIKHSRKNSAAAYSARYILKDVSAESLAKLTGLPVGVIRSALSNIQDQKEL